MYKKSITCFKSLLRTFYQMGSFGKLRLNSLWHIFVTPVSESQLAAAGNINIRGEL